MQLLLFMYALLFRMKIRVPKKSLLVVKHVPLKVSLISRSNSKRLLIFNPRKFDSIRKVSNNQLENIFRIWSLFSRQKMPAGWRCPKTAIRLKNHLKPEILYKSINDYINNCNVNFGGIKSGCFHSEND